MRKLSPVQWVELVVGAGLPTAVFGPFLCLGLFGMTVTALSALLGRSTMTRMSWWAMGIMALGEVIGLAALGSLWLVILMGPQAVCRRPTLRWFAVCSGVLGILTVALLFVKTYAPAYPLLNIWLYLLVGPAVVGLRYLLVLLKGPCAARGSQEWGSGGEAS